MSDRILRSRILDAEGEIDSGYSPAGDGAPVMIGQVFDGGSMPTSLDHYFLVHPVEIDGDPTEGGSGTPAVDAASAVPVDVIGTRVPSAGDYLKCFFIGGRWVAESGGGHVVAVCPNCVACDGIRMALDGTVTDDNGTAAIHYDLASSNWHTSSGVTGFGLTWPGGPVGQDGCVEGDEDIAYGYTFRCTGTPGIFAAVVTGHTAYVTTDTPPAFVGYNLHTITGTCGTSTVTSVLTPTSQDCGAVSVTFSVKTYLGTVVPPDPTAIEIPSPSTTATFAIPLEPVPPSVCCYPCPIPTSDLTLSWIAGDTSTGSTTLHYGSPTDLYPWTSGCVGPIDGFLIKFKLQCDVDTVNLHVESYLNDGSGCAVGSLNNITDNAYTTLADFACRPFHLHWTAASGYTGSGVDILIDP
jgi:hypothetical protein